jgi:ParB family protein of integrating conjugative element (PFGI_1 class)
LAATKTPITLSAADRQAQLAQAGRLNAAAPSSGPLKATTEPGPRPTFTPDEIREKLRAGRDADRVAQATQALTTGERFAPAGKGLKPDDEFDGSTFPLPPSKIKPYDRNPRRSPNPAREEIKESIRVKGILNPITVTRRPDTQDYMVYGGGNTRLVLMQELHAEFPKNELYASMTVVYRAWRGEADVIAAHLIENEARADTTFWDKACGLISLKRELEAETGEVLSYSDARNKAAGLGWKVSRQSVQIYEFATERLAPVGPWLKFTAASLLKDRIGALASCMARLDSHGGAVDFNAILNSELDLHSASLKASQESAGFGANAAELDAVQLCTALEERVAAATGTSVPELRQMLAILATNAQVSANQLRAEAAKGVITPRNLVKSTSTSSPGNSNATAGADAPEGALTSTSGPQMPLPTAMLAAVPAAPPAHAPGAGAASGGMAGHEHSGLPEIGDQGDLPPELTSGVTASPVAGGASPTAIQAAQAVVDAVQHLAAVTLVDDLFRPARSMPLG